MDPRSRLELTPGIVLDARRAVFLADTDTLAVADLHLGYAWAHRARGNLLPLNAGDDTVPRLRALIDDYAPRELAILGDIVHTAAPVPALLDELRTLAALGERTPLRLIGGNHDAQLPGLLRDAAIDLKIVRDHNAGPHLLLHGDERDEAKAHARISATRERGGRVLLGHEHPAITLTDGVTTSTRCACFLTSEEVLVLPAFSSWSAGTDVRGGIFLSPYARATHFTHAIAVIAGKLLPMPV